MKNNATVVDLSPSYELSYIIGVYFGDGTITKYKTIRSYSHVFQLIAKDKDFVEEFLRCFNKISNKTYTVRLYGKYYRAHPCSEQFYGYICDKDIIDFNNVVLKHPFGFLKGFFDSEGGVDIISKFGRRIRISNTDFNLLNYVSDILLKIGISSKIHKENKIGEVIYGKTGKRYVKTKDCYRLHISTKETPLFSKLVSTSIKRKRDRMEVLV